MPITKTSIEELEKMLIGRANEIPAGFSNGIQKESTKIFRDHGIHKGTLWETKRDNGSLYPSEDSYSPYLESN